MSVTGFRYGTSSWSAKSWVGSFYPRGTKPGDFLGFYSTQFGCVEADVTYYRVPDEKLVSGWDRKVPEGFKICAKFPRSIVHGGKGAQPDPGVILEPERCGLDLERFLAAMRLLGEKCGPLVLQFPYMNKRTFDGLDEFLERLDPFLGALPRDLRFAVEVRNSSWFRAPLLECLRSHDVALVLVELGYLPHPAVMARSQDLLTTDFTYARLIGDRKAVEARTDTFDRIVVDQERSLRDWAELLGGLMPRVKETYAFANNHFAGHGPATIRDLAARILGRDAGAAASGGA
jgi:uncharacterized protein YecE (DUF72 family)